MKCNFFLLKIALFIKKINQKKFPILKCKIRNVRVQQHNLYDNKLDYNFFETENNIYLPSFKNPHAISNQIISEIFQVVFLNNECMWDKTFML